MFFPQKYCYIKILLLKYVWLIYWNSLDHSIKYITGFIYKPINACHIKIVLKRHFINWVAVKELGKIKEQCNYQQVHFEIYQQIYF